MRGVVLAGGRGTRMGDSTKVVNKHLLPVYDRPMIYYPIDTLRSMGCDDILIVTSPDAVGALATLLGGGFTYRVQETPNGIAGALARAEGYATGTFPVILGDNYFSDPVGMSGPALFTAHSYQPEAFGVYDSQTHRITEKPKDPASNTVVTGLYVYDDRVFDVIRGLTPSDRGELEITDVNNWYLARNAIGLREVSDVWSDMGTPRSLLYVSRHLAWQKEADE